MQLKESERVFPLSILTCFDEKRGDTEVVCLTRDMIAVPHNFLPLESCRFSVKKVSTQYGLFHDESNRNAENCC